MSGTQRIISGRLCNDIAHRPIVVKIIPKFLAHVFQQPNQPLDVFFELEGRGLDGGDHLGYGK